MADHPNAELIRRGYEAFGRGDLDAVGELLADEIEWTIPGRSLLAGTHKGKAEVFDFFGRLMTLSEGTFSLEVIDILANDDTVVGITRESAAGSRGSFSIQGAHLWHVRDGKATSFCGMNDDPYGEDAYWGS